MLVRTPDQSMLEVSSSRSGELSSSESGVVATTPPETSAVSQRAPASSMCPVSTLNTCETRKLDHTSVRPATAARQ